MYIVAEILGNIFKWYDTPEELIKENVVSFFYYGFNSLVVHKKISKKDIERLTHPKNKTYGILGVRYIGNDEGILPDNLNAPMPQIIDYVIPFNDDAMSILQKYGIEFNLDYYDKPRIRVLDFDPSYPGDLKKVPVRDLEWDDQSQTSSTMMLALYSLTGKYRESLVEQIQSFTGIPITIIGSFDNDMTKSIHTVIERDPDYEKRLKDILTGRLGVVKLESPR